MSPFDEANEASPTFASPGNILITGDSLTQEFALTLNKAMGSCLGGHVVCPNPAESFDVSLPPLQCTQCCAHTAACARIMLDPCLLFRR
jgi:hypothetical protein